MVDNKETRAVNLIVRVEDFKKFAYQDVGLIWTIAFGCIQYPTGKAVKRGDICTLEQGKQWLLFHLHNSVFPLLKSYTVPDKVYAALCSFVYNEGHVGESLIKAINDKNWQELAEAFRLYVYDDGEFCQGLANRREIEIKYFLSA